MNDMNGITVKRINDSIFIPLPASIQRPCPGCSCPWCTAHPQFEPAWDTCVVNPESAHTWTVHWPEINTEHITR
jgi:hypothetical protein